MGDDREIIFESLLKSPIVDQDRLRKLSQDGIPHRLRPVVYMILLLVFGNGSSLKIWAERELIKVYDEFFECDLGYSKDYVNVSDHDDPFESVKIDFGDEKVGKSRRNSEQSTDSSQRRSILNILELLRTYYRYFTGVYKTGETKNAEEADWVLVECDRSFSGHDMDANPQTSDEVKNENTLPTHQKDTDESVTEHKEIDDSNDREIVEELLLDMIDEVEKGIEKKNITYTNSVKVASIYTGASTTIEPVDEKTRIFKHLIEQNSKRYLKYIPSPKNIKQIEVDIVRIPPEHLFFNKLDFSYLYRNVIYAICYQRPTIEYFQGMTDLMVPFVHLFLEFDPINAEPLIYHCFLKLLNHVDTDVLTNCRLQFERVLHLLSRFDTELYNLFNSENPKIIPSMFAHNWIHCMFFRQLNLESWFRMFDSAVSINIPEFLVFFAVSVMRYFRKEFLELEIDELMPFLSKIKKNNIISDRILKKLLLDVQQMRKEYFKA